MTFPNQDASVINYAGCGFWSNPLVMECDLLWRCWNATVFLMIVLETTQWKYSPLILFLSFAAKMYVIFDWRYFIEAARENWDHGWWSSNQINRGAEIFLNHEQGKWKQKQKKNWFFCLLISEKFDASGSFGHTHSHSHTHTHAHTHTHTRAHVHTHAHPHTRTHAHTSKLKIGRHYWLFFLIFPLPVLFIWCNLTFFFRNDGWSKPDFSLIIPLYRYS